MRKITAAQTLCFVVPFFLALGLSIGTVMLIPKTAALGDFRGLTLVAAAITLFYLYAMALYRVFLMVSPLTLGPIPKGSPEEFTYHVYLLFYLVLFQSLTRSRFIPVPLMRLVYLALGARLGENTYSAGTILDPPLTQVGDNVIIGHDAVLFAHAVERDELSLSPIRIGHGATIGAKAVIQPGVIIGDRAVVAVNAVVMKNTVIPPGEVWGGIPARRLRAAEAAELDLSSVAPSGPQLVGEGSRLALKG